MTRHGLLTALLALGISLSGCADLPNNPQDGTPGSGDPSGNSGSSSLIPETPANAKLTQAFFTEDRALVPQPAMVDNRYQHTSHVIGKYVYHIGGYDTPNSKTLDTIERAEIKADSSLGPFERVDAKLDVPRHGHSSERIGDYLYVFGSTLADDDKKVARARILDAEGNIGTFEAVEVTLDRSRGQHASAVIGDHVYLFGGSKANQSTTVSKAPIKADKSLGDFVDAGISLDVGRQLSTLAIIEGNVFLFGGAVSKQNVTVSRATLSSGNVLSNFEKVDATIDKGRHSHSQLVLGRHVYLIGGTGDSKGVSTTIVNADGTLGAFKATSETNYAYKLNNPGHAGHTSLVVGKRAYVFGGNNADSAKRVLVGFLD